jgi:hypothetical protein
MSEANDMTLIAEPVPSPSLTTDGGVAFELKFVVDDDQARRVEDWARQRLAPDAHGEPVRGGAYITTSLYCDTPRFDVFHGTPSFCRSKFRVRRYGPAGWAFVERKSRWGDRVAKRRTPLPLDDLPRLGEPLGPLTWPGDWFHRFLRHLRLVPACRVAYERTAFVGAGLRLTLDRRLRGVPALGWSVDPVDDAPALLDGRVILEFKFGPALPVMFKQLAAELGLAPMRVSKYRLCRAAWAETPLAASRSRGGAGRVTIDTSSTPKAAAEEVARA